MKEASGTLLILIAPCNNNVDVYLKKYGKAKMGGNILVISVSLMVNLFS